MGLLRRLRGRWGRSPTVSPTSPTRTTKAGTGGDGFVTPPLSPSALFSIVELDEGGPSRSAAVSPAPSSPDPGPKTKGFRRRNNARKGRKVKGRGKGGNRVSPLPTPETPDCNACDSNASLPEAGVSAELGCEAEVADSDAATTSDTGDEGWDHSYLLEKEFTYLPARSLSKLSGDSMMGSPRDPFAHPGDDDEQVVRWRLLSPTSPRPMSTTLANPVFELRPVQTAPAEPASVTTEAAAAAAAAMLTTGAVVPPPTSIADLSPASSPTTVPTACVALPPAPAEASPTASLKRAPSCRRRLTSIDRVARRWRISHDEAAELMANVDDANADNPDW
mmetsp:Transcript_31319/g.94081  ORF Transcript_31319/g.94081 Transcript_31319/m.94081 type:complete len:335 (-) Transcript_31319:232-1236(-)